jgi:tectonic-1/3
LQFHLSELPRSLNSASCNTAQTVHFLESDNDYQCSLPGEDRCRPTIRLEEWLANLAVFRLPSYSLSSNGNAGNSSARWGDMDKLAPVVVRICQNSDSGCRSDLPAPEPSCRNSLAAVTLRITHNGTEGIRSVLADLLYTSASAGPVRFQTIHQSLAEMNRPSGGANNPLRTRSGNPGYLTGKPLLVAKLNSSSGEGAYQTLDVFPGTPKSRLIRFGEDSYHAFRMNGIKMDNRTQWCTNWSQFVLESFWGPQLQLLRLGAFGNVELNETEVSSSLWLAIRIQTEELSCFDSLIHGQLVVAYAKSGSYDQPQNKLLGAGLTLRSSGADCLVESSNRCSLQLTQTVSFVMSDSPTFMVLPQPPRWKIQLPHDFFYPFLLSSAGSVLLSPSITLPLFLVVVFYGR